MWRHTYDALRAELWARRPVMRKIIRSHSRIIPLDSYFTIVVYELMPVYQRCGWRT